MFLVQFDNIFQMRHSMKQVYTDEDQLEDTNTLVKKQSRTLLYYTNQS